MTVYQKAEKCEQLIDKLITAIAQYGYEQRGLVYDLEKLESLLNTMCKRLENLKKGIGY
ncbi:MAG: hypothetical protein Q7R95_09245 [bacterium]|nr:hypothetical protein [bacterium]